MNKHHQKLSQAWGIYKLGIALSCCLGLLVFFSQIDSTTANEIQIAAQTWPPETLDIGMSEPNGSLPALFQVPAGTQYRQQYLSGGAGTGWTTWNQNGNFPKFYIEGTMAQGKTPIFTYYNICQSGHGGGGNGGHPCYSQEQNTIRDNLSSAGTMRAYWDDLKLFYEKAAEFPSQTVILHVEPDMWGQTQLLAPNDDANQYPYSVMVSGSGHPDLGGIPNTLPGFAQALFRLRDATNANNVLVVYHVSTWGTSKDFVYSDPNDAELRGLADQSVKFYQSLGQGFDLTFFEMRDRDAGYYQHVWNLPQAWWQPNDFDNHINWIGRYTDMTGQKVMIWQIPYGNTKRPVMNNTWAHYQDNIVETLLGEADFKTLKRYKDSGVVALIFGQGAAGTTCPCDSDNDGSVDDGGYFYEVASNYLNNHLISLSGLNVSFSLKVDGIKLSWTDAGADVYELWWGDTENLAPGSDCSAAPNCLFTSELTYTATLPDGVSERYFIVLYRENGQIAEAAPAIKSVRLTDFYFLPNVGR
ncbi:MAG: hypothetical protein AB8G95_19840 [Anaerolineae bacterium]